MNNKNDSMLTKKDHGRENTSTPKRRRLGTGRILRRNLQGFRSPTTRPDSPCEQQDEPLPCNQIEYLCVSGNNSYVCSNNSGSPGVSDCSVTTTNNYGRWESFDVSKDLTIINKAQESIKEINEIEDISDEMFCSELDLEQNKHDIAGSTSFPSGCEKNFRGNIEESFNAMNQSINEFSKSSKNNNKSSLFETQDSFLLDIKETGMVLENIEPNVRLNDNLSNKDSFYGLPVTTKSLFKSYRNIEKFYDWQEECLNLPAIRNRQNLIYALPTSGGKTLVAEVLMLREVLCRKKNALFILPFVALVQEKIWALSPFAVTLEFLVEEYAAGKGHIPPKKRRNKNSIFVATIEKGLALVRSLLEEDRLDELGLVVVDELHLIGEPGRGATLEILLTTILFANKAIQVVGMSATIGNLPELARFLRAAVFERHFRPVELVEYVKLGSMLHRLLWTDQGLEVVPERQLEYDYSALGARMDPDGLGGLVGEVAPQGSCLVFCATKRNCENVTALLCKLQRSEMLSHRAAEREALSRALAAEGASSLLRLAARCGLGYHHAGLATDERALLENAYRSGVISVLCCTSTLAAGVNLPARRVIVREPRVARQPLSLAAYRQMAGRAGRAQHTDHGESIIICSTRDWAGLRARLAGGLAAARSVLAPALPDLLLSGVALRLAVTRAAAESLLGRTLLALQHSAAEAKQLCEEAVRALAASGAVQARAAGELAVTDLGIAASKGCMGVEAARILVSELTSTRVLGVGCLHLLFLLTPAAPAPAHALDYKHYYSLYCNLDEEGLQTAKLLGITEVNAIRMMTGKPITNVPEAVLRRFYLALMLRDVWNQMPLPAVADKYGVSRGAVQAALSACAGACAGAVRVCGALAALWAWRALLAELAPRLQHCAAPELHQLMELPNVKKARAAQLMRAGYKRVEDVARARPAELSASVPHLPPSAAAHLVSAARMMLIEKVENLRSEAEIVMEELNA